MSYAIKQLSVFLENKPGELGFLTKTLSQGGVSIKSILLADSSDFGLARTLVDDPEKAKAVLENHGLSVRLTDVFGVRIDDVVGSFDRVVSLLSAKEINILYCYSFYESSSGIFIFSVPKEQFDEAVLALIAHGVEIIQAQHFYM
ncbi:amino acid-binding protein [Sulfurospirillum sp. T05]|uniref:Amino acid-binding protein n=1 Tax=Sulfurospirillum tamanense TaxID=2813362 RepID=A0ABS2WSQ2_9BACT|nr:amino acid-binding protein [Sulfurospirillum tamanensis]MBN2964545.1 amino acid-binding protein [Sulfurospirillum tamanensis]